MARHRAGTLCSVVRNRQLACRLPASGAGACGRSSRLLLSWAGLQQRSYERLTVACFTRAWPCWCFPHASPSVCFPRLLPLQPKYLKRWVDLSAVWFKHSKSRGNLRASVEAAGLQCECSACSVQFGWLAWRQHAKQPEATLLPLLLPPSFLPACRANRPCAPCSPAAAAGEGRAHSAIDDARNTARLAIKLMQSGVILVS